MTGPDLPERLGTWVDAGLITRDQADAVEAFEQHRDVDTTPRWVEPVAYLGAVLVAVAIILFGVELWDRLEPWGRLTLAVVVTVVLLGTGWLLGRSDAAAGKRASAFAYFVGLASVAWAAGVAFYDVVDLDEETAVVLTAGTALVAGVVLFIVSRTALQHVAMAVVTAAFVLSLMAVLPITPSWLAALLLFAAGLIWMLLTWGDVLVPPAVGWVIGSLFVLALGFGTVETEGAWWSGAAILVALGLVWLATRLDLRSVLGVGALGLVVWIPTTVIQLFEDSLAVPVAILITGIVTLAVVVVGVRATRDATDG